MPTASQEEEMDASPTELDSFFNDLSQPTSRRTSEQDEPQSGQSNAASRPTPKAKRIACILCRKRKLKCDGSKPACGTCKRLSHDCSYDEVRKKSGPKRGYVKALEARLGRSSATCWRKMHDFLQKRYKSDRFMQLR